MANNNINIVNANVSINRGTHDLLDYSSKQRNYSAALIWAQDTNSNAAVGQFIYIEEDEVIAFKTYTKGAYIVEAVGLSAVLTPLSKGIAGSSELIDRIDDLMADISTLENEKADVFATGNGLERTPKTSSAPAKISVKLNADANNALSFDTSGGLKASVAEYSVSKLETPTAGFSASYELLKDGKRAGVLIDIPKDMVISSGRIITADTELVSEHPELTVGVKYIEFTIANASADKLYIAVNDLVDVYTSGDKYISVSSDNKIGLNISEVSKTVLTDVKADAEISGALDELNPQKQGSLAKRVGTIETTVGDATGGLVKNVADLTAKTGTIETNVNAIKAKVDGLDASKINTTRAIGDNAAGDSVEDVLADMSDKLDAVEDAIKDGTGVTDIQAGDGISVDKTNAARPTVSLKLNSNVPSEIASVSEDGLVILDMRSRWYKF